MHHNDGTTASPTSAQYPRPSHILWHLSDTHFVGDDLLYGSVDSPGYLRELFDQVDAGGPRPDAIVITGDLADAGDPRSYHRLREIVEPVAHRVGAEIVWVMGNHDSRPAFRAGLLDQDPSQAPVDQVRDLNGLRIITLDSTVPGAHHGEVTDEQLRWLARELSVPAEFGTILAMHHPPVPSVLDLAVLVELRDQRRLAEVLAGTDVRSILAGHLHYSTFATFAGIPVSVASATCYTQDLNVPSGAMRARDGSQAFNLVHVYENTVVHSVSPIRPGTTIRYVSVEQAAKELDTAGVRIEPARLPSAAVGQIG